MTDNLEEVFASMNASRILVAILENIGPVSVSTETFMNANENDRNLKVEYDNENVSFIFRLEDKVE